MLRGAAKADQALDEQAYGRADGAGGSVRLALWNHPGDDIYGMFTRSRRIVDRVAQLLEDEPYHYHSKMIMKQARTGGAWEWHQDYGYWYENGVLRPNLCSVFIAVDPATRENGCMQVLRRSHEMGRMNHVKIGDQTGADPERIAAAAEQLELVYVDDGPRRRAVLSPQFAPPQRSESLAQRPLGANLLLQRPAQLALQRRPASAVHAAGGGGRWRRSDASAG